MTLEESVENLDLVGAKEVLEQLRAFKGSAAYGILISDVKTAAKFFDDQLFTRPTDVVDVLNRENALASRNMLQKHAETLTVLEELLVDKTENIQQ